MHCAIGVSRLLGLFFCDTWRNIVNSHSAAQLLVLCRGSTGSLAAAVKEKEVDPFQLSENMHIFRIRLWRNVLMNAFLYCFTALTRHRGAMKGGLASFRGLRVECGLLNFSGFSGQFSGNWAWWIVLENWRIGEANFLCIAVVDYLIVSRRSGDKE